MRLGTVRQLAAGYANGVTPIDRTDTKDWLARVEQMVVEYRADQQRRFLQQVTKFRRLAEAIKTRLASEKPPHLH